MSIQWTVIASFLYVEIATVLVLLLPFISAHRWQRLFKSRFLKALENQSNLYFTVFIFILVLFFLDAIREVRKYTGEIEDTKLDSHAHLSAELQIQMKLFRAQRNFYISGFALFLWLVLRRLVTLISAQATLQAANIASLKQAQNASETAQKLMDEGSKKTTSADNLGNIAKEEQVKQIEQLKKELSASKDDLKKAKFDVDAMKSQSESLAKEYDRVAEENVKLQSKINHLVGTEHSKKDE